MGSFSFRHECLVIAFRQPNNDMLPDARSISQASCLLSTVLVPVSPSPEGPAIQVAPQQLLVATQQSPQPTTHL
jgi:hypothetical protein